LDAHREKGKKHQAISLFLFRKNKTGEFELLLQQRSNKKIVGALQWANNFMC
jgi:isopentenyldiphosphate isomerase